MKLYLQVKQINKFTDDELCLHGLYCLCFGLVGLVGLVWLVGRYEGGASHWRLHALQCFGLGSSWKTRHLSILADDEADSLFKLYLV
jgi:hypothetical protein